MRYGEQLERKLSKEELEKSLKFKMGFFGSDVQTVAVNQAADGKATADISVNAPLWEVILIGTLVSIIIYVMCTCGSKLLRKKVEKTIQKAVQQV